VHYISQKHMLGPNTRCRQQHFRKETAQTDGVRNRAEQRITVTFSYFKVLIVKCGGMHLNSKFCNRHVERHHHLSAISQYHYLLCNSVVLLQAGAILWEALTTRPWTSVNWRTSSMTRMMQATRK
jgi:hypothetical protein